MRVAVTPNYHMEALAVGTVRDSADHMAMTALLFSSQELKLVLRTMQNISLYHSSVRQCSWISCPTKTFMNDPCASRFPPNTVFLLLP